MPAQSLSRLGAKPVRPPRHWPQSSIDALPRYSPLQSCTHHLVLSKAQLEHVAVTECLGGSERVMLRPVAAAKSTSDRYMNRSGLRGNVVGPFAASHVAVMVTGTAAEATPTGAMQVMKLELTLYVAGTETVPNRQFRVDGDGLRIEKSKRHRQRRVKGKEKHYAVVMQPRSATAMLTSVPPAAGPYWGVMHAYTTVSNQAGEST